MFLICLQGMNFWQRMAGFQGMFFICLWRYEFLTKDGWIFSMPFICLWGMNFWWRVDEFQGVFFICLQGMNFWWRMDEFQGIEIHTLKVRFSNCRDTIYVMQIMLNGWIWGVWKVSKYLWNSVDGFSHFKDEYLTVEGWMWLKLWGLL